MGLGTSWLLCVIALRCVTGCVALLAGFTDRVHRSGLPTGTGHSTTRGRPRSLGDGLAYEPGLSRLAVRGVRVATRAVLLHLQSVRVVTPVLLGDVVPLLALHAGQRDLRADVGGSHRSAP